MNNASASIAVFPHDDGFSARRRCALDERLQRWAKWSLSGRPLARLGLPRQSTLAGIQDLQLTERVKRAETVRARQSTVSKMVREEENWDEEITEQAVTDLGVYCGGTSMLIVRAEYLWIVPVLDKTTGNHLHRRIPREPHEPVKTHRRRMAAILGRSLERYHQLLAETYPALALLIEKRDPGWIAAACSK